jgi:hypothetical protein
MSDRNWRIVGGVAAVVGGGAALAVARNTRQRIGAVLTIASGIAALVSELV